MYQTWVNRTSVSLKLTNNSVELNLDQLKEIFPSANTKVLDNVLVPLNAAMKEFGIDSPYRCAGFIAQCAHESVLFTAAVENLNYSATGLVNTWPKRFTLELAQQYERQPERIANYVYANILGNGETASGDGWRYRGRGMLGITGRSNYMECGRSLGLDLVAHPELLEEMASAAQSAGWFWKLRKVNAAADADDIKKMTYLINGGYIGLDQRTRYYAAAKKVLLAAAPLAPVAAELVAPTEVVTSSAEPKSSFVDLLISLLRKLFRL